MSREGDYCKCSKRRPVVCREKATTASVVRGGQWYVVRRRLKCSKRQPVVWREKATTTSVVRGGQWYVTRRRLLQV